MKLRRIARAFQEHEPTSLAHTCKRLLPLIPAPVGLKSFVRPESGTRKPESSEYVKKEFTQAEAPVGGTRWNPTPEQIGILEMLYGGGMRTPNAPQIEQITAQLAKYGKIEGKNVFYWFQNHKARERQKKKRSGFRPLLPPPPPITSLSPGEESDCSSQKRKSRSWCEEVDYKNYDEEEDEEKEDRTLELFPLRPEGRIN